MKSICVALVTALLLQAVSLPCMAQESIVLKGYEINSASLKTNMYVVVSYQIRGKQVEAKGYIQSIHKNDFSILDISMKTIKYQDVISLQIKPMESKKKKVLKQSPVLGIFYGAQVQIEKRNANKPILGKVTSVNSDTLFVLYQTKQQEAVAFSDMNQIWVRKYPHYGLKGSLYGFTIGFVSGAVVGANDGDDPPGWLAMSAGDKAMIAGVLFGVIGIGIGAVVGGIYGANHVTWQALPLKNFHLGLSPDREGGLAFTAMKQFQF